MAPHAPLDPLDGLDTDQRQAVTAAFDRPLAVIAGPGSGKTRTMVARLAAAGAHVDPTNMLALTHTTKAAGELGQRCRAAGVGSLTAATVHAAAWRQVRHFWAQCGYDGEPQLASSTWPMVRDAVAVVVGDSETATISEVAGEIEWARAWRLTPAQYHQAALAHGRTAAVTPETVSGCWEVFTAAKRRLGVLDFADVLDVAAGMLDDPAVAAAVRKRWQLLVVDEYQDIDHAQQYLIDKWLGASGQLTVTGDPEQAIFGFKGGDPTLLTGFAKRYPHANVVHLLRNYRSSAPVVAWVNKLTTIRRPPLVSAQSAGPAPEVKIVGDEAGEEAALTTWLRARHAHGVPWSQMAVLYRFNATAARLEAALLAAGIPHQVAGSARFFERPEVRAVLDPFARAARAQPNASGVTTLLAAARAARFDPDAPPAGVGPARQRWEAVAALVDHATTRADAGAGELLESLRAQAEAAHDLTPGGVTLASVHAAKGLEWDAVWLVGACEGQLPSVYAVTDDQVAAEQHLLYVAASRARAHLVISAARRRHNNWRAEPSRFLKLLDPPPPPRRSKTSSAPPAGVAPTRAHQLPGCSRCGERLRGAAQRRTKICSPACLDASRAAHYAVLVAWRDERVLALGVASSQVATDQALFAVAALGSADGVVGLGPHAGVVPTGP